MKGRLPWYTCTSTGLKIGMGNVPAQVRPDTSGVGVNDIEPSDGKGVTVSHRDETPSNVSPMVVAT